MDFLTFILDAEQDAKLTEDFLAVTATGKINDVADKLRDFFKEKSYTKITLKDCENIIKARRQAVGLFVDFYGGFGGCPPGTHY